MARARPIPVWPRINLGAAAHSREFFAKRRQVALITWPWRAPAEQGPSH